MSNRTMMILAVGFLAVAVWWYYHKTCPACQKRWAMLKNKLGSRMIEPKPDGGF